jgi:hypothetical protein
MTEIQHLIQADEFYLPAMHDFAFLDRHLLEASTHRIQEVIEYPIIKAGAPRPRPPRRSGAR